MKTLLKNAKIVTCDNKKVVENGYMAIEDDKIVYVGENEPSDFCADITNNLHGKTVMPGLINAHSHVAMTVLRSYSEGYRLQEWLTDKIFPIEDKLSREDIYTSVQLGIAEMLRFGTTAVNDCYFFSDRAADAFLEAGFRANISRCLMNPDGTDFSKDYRVCEEKELFLKYDGAGDGLLKIEVFPHAVYTCSEDYLKRSAELAREYGMPVSSHLCENETEVSECMEKYNMTPVEVYKKCGLLDQPANFAHCVVLNDNDISLLKGHTITHNPVSNLKLGSGIADIYRYMKNGINIALGTDGASSNNNLNMFEEVKIAALLMSGINKDPSTVQPQDILDMATVNGSVALKRDDVGVLRAGARADYIVIDSEQLHYYPDHSIVNNLVYSAQGSDVETTVVNGKVLYHKGEYKTIDIERVKSDIMKIKKELF